MNVVIVGNHNIVLVPGIVSKIAAYMVVLSELSPAVNVRVRSSTASMSGASPVEQTVIMLARELGLPWNQVRPSGGGRSGVYDRDYALMDQADYVMAFFRQDRVMTGGTGHVVHAALTKGVPVEAWAVTDDGNLESVGSDDGCEVDYEGSRWMQLRYLEWQTKQVEENLAGALSTWGAVTSTTAPVFTPMPIYTLRNTTGEYRLNGSFTNGKYLLTTNTSTPKP